MTAPERAGREGDTQPLPTPNDQPDIQSQVVADITARRELGIRRYGTPLQPHNGRNALQDAYEEALDLAVYLKQVLVEQAAGWLTLSSSPTSPPWVVTSTMCGACGQNAVITPNGFQPHNREDGTPCPGEQLTS